MCTMVCMASTILSGCNGVSSMPTRCGSKLLESSSRRDTVARKEIDILSNPRRIWKVQSSLRRMLGVFGRTFCLAIVCLLLSRSVVCALDTQRLPPAYIMSLIPLLGGRGTNVWDPFSLTSACQWDPFEVFSTGGGLTSQDLAITPQQSVAQDVSAVLNTRVDWLETPDAHIIKADLPGLSKDEVKVEIEDGRTLKIVGERGREKVDVGDRWHRVERMHGRFVRRFRLPENARLDEVHAKVENGVLEVRIPKLQEQKPGTRAVDIK